MASTADKKHFRMEGRHVTAIAQLIRSFRERIKPNEYRVGSILEAHHVCEVRGGGGWESN